MSTTTTLPAGIKIRVADPKALEDPENLELLAQFNALLEANPLQRYNNPTLGRVHPKQVPFHAAKEKIRLFIGGNRSGKTSAGIVDNLIQALDEDWVPEHLKPYKRWEPPFYCRIVTPDFGRSLAAVKESIQKWVPREQLLGGSWEDAFEKQERTLRFRNESFMEFMSYEQDEDKFGGSARHRIQYDEEMPPTEKSKTIHDECSMRLVDFDGDELYTFTPLYGLGPMFDEFWENRGREIQNQVWEGEVVDDDSGVTQPFTLVQADIDDNAFLSETGKQRALAKLPAKVREARARGNFEHFKGLVYEDFDPERHEVPVPSKDHVRSQEIYLGIDPGIRTTAVVFCAFDKDNAMLIFDELALSDASAIPRNASVAIKDKLAYWNVKPKFVLIDPSSRNRELVNAENVQAAYAREGINAYPAQNQLEAGVFELMRRIESDPPLLYVADNCLRWLKERSRYRRDEKEDGTFAVVKQNDHLMDATRYVAMAHPLPTNSFTPRKQQPKRWEPGTAPPMGTPTPVDPPPMGSYS